MDEFKSVLRTDQLVKRYGQRTVANHVSINVKQGEIVGLLGPNGAGKTTTFYMTTGLIVPNEGRIFLDDQDITKFPVYKRAQAGIGYLAQEASVYRKMTVEDNLKATLQMTGLSDKEQDEKLESLIAEFRLQRCAAIWATVCRAVNAAVVRLPAAWPFRLSSSCSMSPLPELTRLRSRISNTLFIN